MKLSKKLMAAAVTMMMVGSLSVPASAGVIDLGDITLDESTGYQWLDMSFTDGLSYNAVVGGVVDTVHGGGWVIATRDEVLELWGSITGIYSWNLNSSNNSDLPALEIASLLGFTYETSYQSTKELYGRHSGEAGNGLLGFQLVSYYPDSAYVSSQDDYYTEADALYWLGTWLVRKPITPSGGVSSEAVPEPSTLGLLGVGFMSLGMIGYGRRRREMS